MHYVVLLKHESAFAKHIWGCMYVEYYCFSPSANENPKNPKKKYVNNINVLQKLEKV